jgi:pimeloyl-ACP methyl ester carboxylesterase
MAGVAAAPDVLGSFPIARRNPAVVEHWASAVSKLLDPIDPDFVIELQRSTLARPRAFLDRVVQESLKVPARVWRAALEGLFRIDHSGELAKIKAPRLIVWGDRDAFVLRRDQDALADATAGSDGPLALALGAR